MARLFKYITEVLALVGLCYAKEYRVVAVPSEYGGSFVAVVIDDGTSIQLEPTQNGYFWVGKGNDPTNNYYYVITDSENNIIASENQGTQIDGTNNQEFAFIRGDNGDLNDVYGRPYSKAGDLLRPIPRAFDPLDGYKKFSELFQEGEVQNVRAYCPDENQVNALLNNRGDNIDISITGCDLSIISSGSDKRFTNVTIELSGQGSRGYPKRPFKIKLDSDSADKNNQKIHGRDKFKLRNCVFDCTYIKNKLAIDLSTSLGLPAGQATPARFYLNNYAFGLYDMADVFKKKLIKNNFHFKEDKPKYGVLYKAKTYQGITRNYLVQNPDIYSEIYDIAFIPDDKKDNPYGEITELIDWIANTLPTASDSEIENFINVDLLLKDIVVEYLIDHRDGFFIAGNNYYIYKSNGKFNVWSFDFDATFDKFALYPVNTPWDEYQNIPASYSDTLNRNPLVEGVLSHEKFRNRFVEILKTTVSEVFNSQSMNPRIAYFQEFLKADMNWDTLVHPPAQIYDVLNGEDITYTYDQICTAFTDLESYTCSGDSTSLYAYVRMRSQVVVDQYQLQTTCDYSKGSVGNVFESSAKILLPSAMTTLFLISTILLYLRYN
ncbi:coth-domain-containing protein [Piromyces finnis]|uniref:Coth-domain-containing protein n=1 Tax=Piromyces finnis TaxID=1754191 RepID=A0A1Y1VHT3_9FUNG|nr:coth-domain-containing protein [Piromyces finnis]|eukprot:ORX55331.1 coth-domain-containing protein [Piromyces finnis]